MEGSVRRFPTRIDGIILVILLLLLFSIVFTLSAPLNYVCVNTFGQICDFLLAGAFISYLLSIPAIAIYAFYTLSHERSAKIELSKQKDSDKIILSILDLKTMETRDYVVKSARKWGFG
jgi:hypothetical protein